MSSILRMNIDDQSWRHFLGETHEFERVVLDRRPYARLVLAHRFQQIFGRAFVQKLISAVRSPEQGVILLSYPEQPCSFNDHLRLATAISYILGLAAFDEMTKNYYADIMLTPEAKGDSYLWEPFKDLRLHTDGTFYKNPVHWVVLAKIKQEGVQGGELSLHHIDDIEGLSHLLKHPLAFSEFSFEASASKQVGGPVKQSIFFKNEDRIGIRFSDQFCHPQNIEEALFIEEISERLERSSQKMIEAFPSSELLVLNNSYWLHGRLKINPDFPFKRQLLRMRGSFFPQG